MDLIKIAQDLIKFRSISGNIEEINKAIAYIENLFVGTNAKIEIYRGVTTAPVTFIANTDDSHFDVLILGHIDVVPAKDEMFEPYIKNGKMYGRGTLDMKSFAAIALNSMHHALENNINLKFGVILSSDEEIGSNGLHSFLDVHPELKTTIVLDNDVGGDIYKIINKCKNPIFCKLISKGKKAHGSTPWEGIDANEKLIKSCINLRKIYPYYSLDGAVPDNKWIDTLHIAKISGGETANVISDYAEAILDLRLTETSKVEDAVEKIKTALEDSVELRIISQGNPVVMSEKNSYILQYKELAEKVLGKTIEFQQIGGATDSKEFYLRGSTVIMHSGSGEGMHGDNEYVELKTVEDIAKIQLEFIYFLAKKKYTCEI